MTYKEFLRQLRRHKRLWSTRVLYRRGQIRTADAPYGDCPITAIARAVAGTSFHPCNRREAVRALHLNIRLAEGIGSAADCGTWGIAMSSREMEIRRDLLRATGLRE